MFLHSFNTESLLTKLGTSGSQKAQRSFFSHFLLAGELLRRTGRVILLSALACAGGVTSSVSAATELPSGLERSGEEESRRGRRHDSRFIPAMAAWQAGDHNWRAALPPKEGLGDWVALSTASTHSTISSDTSVSSLNVQSIGSTSSDNSARMVSFASNSSSSSTRSRADFENEMLDIPMQATMHRSEVNSQRSTSSASSRSDRSDVSGASANLSSRNSQSEFHSVASLPSSSSSSSSSRHTEAEGNAIALQHSGGMDLKIPVIDEMGAVVGGGSIEVAVSPVASTNSMATVHQASVDAPQATATPLQAPADNLRAKISLQKPAKEGEEGEITALASSEESRAEPFHQPKSETQNEEPSPAASSSAISIPSATPIDFKQQKTVPLDQQILELRHQIKQDRRIIYGGIAAAMAMPNVTPSPGKTAVAIGAANFKGQSALGMGVTWRSIGGETHINLAVGASAASVGVRVQAAREF